MMSYEQAMTLTSVYSRSDLSDEVYDEAMMVIDRIEKEHNAYIDKLIEEEFKRLEEEEEREYNDYIDRFIAEGIG